MDPLMKELIRVTDSYKCAIKGTGSANPSEVHEIIQLYIYKRLKWFVKQHQVHKTK